MRFRVLFSVLGCFMLLNGCAAQGQIERTGVSLQIEPIKVWPSEVSETSGLAYFDHYFWTINDSGGKASVYAFDESTQNLVKRVDLKKARNVDWEALAQDDNYLYVADCGDNKGGRAQLQIYKVAQADLAAAKDKKNVATSRLDFEYADRATDHSAVNNFDCEAITVVDDHIWLFSKNRGDLHTRFYQLDTQTKKQRISPLLTLPVAGLITDADYFAPTQQLVLLGYQKASLFGGSFIWVIDVVEGQPDWSTAVYHAINPYGQWEAILWKDAHTLIVTSEQSPLGTQQIGSIKLPPLY